MLLACGAWVVDGVGVVAECVVPECFGMELSAAENDLKRCRHSIRW